MTLYDLLKDLLPETRKQLRGSCTCFASCECVGKTKADDEVLPISVWKKLLKNQCDCGKYPSRKIEGYNTAKQEYDDLLKRVRFNLAPEYLHELYLEATKKLNPESYNPNAQKQYKDLTAEQQFIDKYIAQAICQSKDILTFEGMQSSPPSRKR